MKKVFKAAITLALAILSFACTAEDARRDVVERLYKEYAWETQPGISKRTPFFNEKLGVLEKYLSKSLVNLLIKDRKCAERTREICRLDFDPMWNSQDPEGAKSRVANINPGNTVSVAITYPGQPPQALAFDLVQTETGWRIHDIRSQTPKWSLRNILAGK